jgi:hypothetical protein
MYGRAVHGAQRPKLPKPLNLQRGYRTACRVHDELYRSNSNAGGGGELDGRPAAGMDAERPAVSWERKRGKHRRPFIFPPCLLWTDVKRSMSPCGHSVARPYDRTRLWVGDWDADLSAAAAMVTN